MVRCIVETCTTTYTQKGRCTKPEGLKMHRFPGPVDRLLPWIQSVRSVNGPKWQPPAKGTARICSLHFPPACYELNRQDGVVKLKWNAVPSVFNSSAPPPISTTVAISTPAADVYSVARLGERNSRKKVLENIVNSRTRDHVYASPRQPPPSSPPVCEIQSTQSLESGNSEMIICPCVQLDENSADSFEETSPSPDITLTISSPTEEILQTSEEILQTSTETSPLQDVSPGSQEVFSPPQQVSSFPKQASQVQKVSRTQIQGWLSNGLVHMELPDGSLAQLLPGGTPFRSESPKYSFTDSEVDKIQIRQLSEENRKLQTELERIRGVAEKLLRQNERLRQQNRVTSSAYRSMKQLLIRSTDNLSKRLNKDQIKALSLNSTRGQKWSSETLEEANALRAVCGNAMYKTISQRIPYPSLRTLQEGIRQRCIAGEPSDLSATELTEGENFEGENFEGEIVTQEELILNEII